MIKCSKCGAELSDDTKFCSYCGNRINATTPPPAEEDSISFETSHKTSHPETTWSNGDKVDAPKSLADKIKDKASDKWRNLSTYGKITTVAMSAFVLLCLVALLFGKTAAAIIAILQIVLTVAAVLMKKQVIKVPQKWLHIVALVLAVILLVPYMTLFGMDYGDAEKFAWSDILLADVIPEPKSHLGEILANSDEYLSLYVYKTSAEDYSKYVDACEEKGFTVEAEQSDLSYYAYNADGYKLSLYYDENDSKMSISVDAAEEYGALVWPDSEIASMLPVPKSTTGEITQDDEKGFAAYVSDTPIEEYNAYVAACADKGFTVEASESEKSYSAKNSNGYQLSVSYQGNGVMSISVDEPEYAVSLEIECVENLLFSKYDVDVYVDDSMQGTISHGTTETYNLNLTKGVYEIKFVSAEDDEVTGGVSIDIYQDESLKYKISCTSSQINVETIQGTVSQHGEDEAAIPQSASSYKYQNYVDVQTELSEAGFTNISFEILYDIELGWTEEGEVDSVSVDGNAEFEQGDIFKKDIAIVITYHMPEEDDPNKPVESETPNSTTEPTTEPAENLTVENCPDLAAMLSNKAEIDDSYSAFATKYKGRIIEFDGRIDYCTKHGDYNTRFDYLVSAGDYDPDHQIGPAFKFEDVNYYDLNTDLDTVSVGLNVRIVAEVISFDSNSGLFYLEPVSVTGR